jgi:hypothetical protein
MKRWIGITTMVFGLLAITAGPAVANAPRGQGLVSLGDYNCEGFGTVSVFGPRGNDAPTAFTTDGQHVVAVSISATFTDLEGNVFTFSKSFGAKTGLTTFTCTQHFEEPGEGSGDVTVVVALVPPQ